MSSVVIIDVGTGNLHSVHKAIEHVAPTVGVRITSDPDVVARAERVIFPGQGAIGSCVAALEARGLRHAILDAAANKPFLGICLGLQLLYASSEEDGGTPGLDLFAGRVRAFAGADAQRMLDPVTGRTRKIPHMGWNQVNQAGAHPLWRGIAQDERFYFVHSYYADADAPGEVTGWTEYGVRFVSAAGRNNVFAVQFHPEKSQHAGLALLGNFTQWDGSVP